MKKSVNSPQAPAPIGPYSQALSFHDLLFVSGQIPLDNHNELHLESIEMQTQKVMDNLGHILQAAGSSFDDVIKCTIFITQMEYFVRVNEIYSQYFKAPFPARETVAVSGLPKGVDVEISCIAIKRNKK